LKQESNIDEDVWNELALLHEKLNPAKVSSYCLVFVSYWLVFKAHRLLYHSTLGMRVIKKKKKKTVSLPRFRAKMEQLNRF